ncbi:DUF2178 domain-containing protein [Methanospirillum sp. J.3.6.1-F.2.7.3]|jgi:uncharacterized membrane protein|uniref:DUF2178 domain-containing protein n=2 Tax=Methanospirillum TaxID=2202 RepID=A0A8E7EJM8_9EURY|nr:MULTISPECIES: DUF2178 domain-containing protein [Methanospirillum]MDX8549437.1 DUF2178 domain-containing protein [Methanospirillum hungatei]NLW76437.1 DUF2178 domain-containing protein [Methanomicrobiales archaeon]QVV89279.1 DUF2178 domain-containing protein [Methanospirillum sp. J.3.6.1-F.2.7.3]QXO93483.1 DUF2178 domain-containing protein [Methanospirillum hungatei]
MKQYTYFLLLGIIAILEVGIFYWSVENLEPLIMTGAVVIGVLAAWISRQMVDDVITDERSHLITEKASLRTLQVMGITLFSYALGGVVISIGGDTFGPFSYQIARFSFLLMFIVFLMIIVYILFISWYERKFGAGGEDEE